MNLNSFIEDNSLYRSRLVAHACNPFPPVYSTEVITPKLPNFMSCKNYRSMHAYMTPTGIYNAEMMTSRLPIL